MLHGRSRYTRYWVRMAGWTLIAAAASVAIFNGTSWRVPGRLMESLAISLTFTICIVPLIGIVMPRVVPAVRLSSPLRWVIVLGVLAGIAVTGSAAAIGLLIAVGRVPPSQFGGWLSAAVRVSLLMTLIFGVAGTMFETLHAQLDETVVALRTKERDEADARRMAAEAQLASLEARVDPHFLFNTLNSIAALVRDNPAAAERTIEQLASLMRSSLDRSASPLVRLDDELATVRSYLEIERVRFGERLRFHIDSAEATGAALVPRLALQTLTENSVKYAVSASREGATVVVRAALHDGRLQISVEDD